MKPDRFEILVRLSGVTVVARIVTAVFGLGADEPRISPDVGEPPFDNLRVRACGGQWSTTFDMSFGRTVLSAVRQLSMAGRGLFAAGGRRGVTPRPPTPADRR
jgi:hypothetical protein